MFSFKLHLIDYFLEANQGAVILKPLSRVADIILCDEHKKVGTIEILFDPSLDNSVFNPETPPIKTAPKRKSQSCNFVLPMKQPKIFAPNIINSPTADTVLSSKANPEALVNITQNLTTGEKSFQCSMCGFSSSRKDTTKRHIELKHLPKTTVLKCQLCDYTASLKFQMKRHYTGKHSLPEQAANGMLM